MRIPNWAVVFEKIEQQLQRVMQSRLILDNSGKILSLALSRPWKRYQVHKNSPYSCSLLNSWLQIIALLVSESALERSS